MKKKIIIWLSLSVVIVFIVLELSARWYVSYGYKIESFLHGNDLEWRGVKVSWPERMYLNRVTADRLSFIFWGFEPKGGMVVSREITAGSLKQEDNYRKSEAYDVLEVKDAEIAGCAARVLVVQEKGDSYLMVSYVIDSHCVTIHYIGPPGNFKYFKPVIEAVSFVD